MENYLTEVKRIAIIGSGLIGRNWAILFARAGFDVNLFDVSASQTETALNDVTLKLLEYSGSKTGCVKIFTSLPDCLDGVQYLQECVPETTELKADIFKKIDDLLINRSTNPGQSDLHLDGGIVLASSSSSIPCSQFTSTLTYKSKCIIAHPLNPPLYCPLVEVVPASYTDPMVTKLTFDLMKKIGQKPILLRKEVPGFAVNRIQYAMLAECWRLVQDEVLNASDVDQVMTDGLGLRYAFFGPFLNCHLNAQGLEDYMERYGSGMRSIISEFGPCPTFDGPTLARINKEMEDQISKEALADGRKEREKCLGLISILKQNIGL